MEKSLATLDKGTTCSSWNYSGDRLATGSIDGTLSIFDSENPASSSFNCTSKVRVGEGSVVKVVWIPPVFGDAVACIDGNGSMYLWEEVAEDGKAVEWKHCTSFQTKSVKVLDVQFGVFRTSLKMVIPRFSPLFRLDCRMYQAEFQNVTDSVAKLAKVSCLSASISWNPQSGDNQELSFVLGFNSDTPLLNSSKVWEFDLDHQRWVPVAELALPEDINNQVFCVAWAANIGRPYEIIAVASNKGIAIWNLGTNPDMDGRLSVERVALLSGFEGEVWQMEWDMSGMTLATTGSDGMVRLWQSNLNGVWHQQAALEPTT
ncbi:Protein SEH1 [Linum grandiflorum]